MTFATAAGLLTAGLVLAGAPAASAADGPADNDLCAAVLGAALCQSIAQANVLADGNSNTAVLGEGE
ncbi:hypothetical protein [Streptomyces sp. NPDC058867]|uniref:hypothetical protein n=1 Tax=unclassified Streptomyces TaxID=2593676 RepID=UPI0036929ABB